MKSKELLFNGLVAVAMLFTATSCTNAPKQNQSDEQEQTIKSGEITQREVEIDKAVCVLHPTEGNKVKGTVTFTQNGVNVNIVADLEGLTPGKHGFHIHEFGDCSKLDGTSAGGHFNPSNRKHGGHEDTERHVGDLGNIVADDSGKAHLELTDNLIGFSGANSIIGRAIIVHAGEDDLNSQPTGAAGARVACGVIGIAKSNP